MSEGILKKFYRSKTYLLVGLVVLVFVSFAFVRAYYQNYQVHEEIRKLQDSTAQLESKKLDLQKYLKYAESDAYVEEKARTDLNMAKDGENVTIVSGNTEDFTRQNPDVVVQSSPVSNIRKWWQYFFNN